MWHIDFYNWHLLIFNKQTNDSITVDEYTAIHF